MKITVNQIELMVSKETIISDIIDQSGYRGSIAAFVNGKQLLMSEYGVYKLSENDVVTLVKPLGGG